MGRVAGFNHFNVSVADMDRSLTFWHELLELDLLGRGTVRYPHLDQIVGLRDTEIEWAELRLPSGGLIELFRYHHPPGEHRTHGVNDSGTTHLCLEVEGIDEVVARLRRAGVPTLSEEPVRIPFGDWEGFRCVYVKDPDGITIELVERPESSQKVAPGDLA